MRRLRRPRFRRRARVARVGRFGGEQRQLNVCVFASGKAFAAPAPPDAVS